MALAWDPETGRHVKAGGERLLQPGDEELSWMTYTERFVAPETPADALNRQLQRAGVPSSGATLRRAAGARLPALTSAPGCGNGAIGPLGRCAPPVLFPQQY